MAPYVRPVDVHLYVSSNDVVEEIAEKLELNPTPKVGNVKFVLPYDEGVFYGTCKVRDVKVVSNVQLYVDLYDFPARGEEAAEMILRVLEKQWAPQKG